MEQLDRPQLQGKPVIVGGDPKARGVVSTCSYEVREYGTRSKTLPEAVNGDTEIYRVVKELFSKHCGKPPWRLVGVKASGFERGSQLSFVLPTPVEEKEKRLLLTKDRLRKKYGTEVLFHAKRLSKDKRDEK